MHPGGRRIIENVESALDLNQRADRAQLATCSPSIGNVGTPSIMYVLRDTIELRKPEPGQRGLTVTSGPA